MGLLKIIKEFRFVKTANIIYTHEYDGTLFVERCFASDLPQKGDAIIYKGIHYRVGTRWFDKDQDFIEIDLSEI